MHRTPLLLDVRNGTFEAYLHSLAKTGRKNFKHVEKINADLRYHAIPFEAALVRRFMLLWEQQPIAGRKRQWAFGVGFLEFLQERGQLLCFAATRGASAEEILALHFVEKHGDYVFCHPPMYDKTLHSERSIAKYMWFRLIEWSLADPGIGWLDLGGGNNGSWRDLLMNRAQHEGYKWLYVPEAVKRSPHTAPAYYVHTKLFPYGMRLHEAPAEEGPLATEVRGKLISFIWMNRKRRARKLASALSRVWHPGQAG